MATELEATELGKELLTAAQEQNVDEVKRLLALGADPNAKDESHGQTAVTWAARRCNLELVKALCDGGASFRICDDEGRSPVYWAAVRESQDVLSFFLSLEDVASCPHGQGGGILFVLAEFGQPQDLERFINKPELKLQLNSHNDNGSTPLMLAAKAGQGENVRALLKAGANHSLEDNDRRTALYYAVEGGDLATVRALVGAGADPYNLCAIPTDESEILTATLLATAGDTESWKAFIDTEPDLALRNAYGDTSIHLAARLGAAIAVERLVDAGCDVNALGEDDCTPLIDASSAGHLSAVESLIKKGADAAFPGSEFGNTPLISAAGNGHGEIVELLCPLSNVDAPGWWGLTAMTCAAENGHVSCIEALIRAKANVNTIGGDQNAGRGPPLWHACRNEKPEAVQALIRAGADLYWADPRGRDGLGQSQHNLDIVKAFVEEPRENIEDGGEPTPRVRAAELALRYSCDIEGEDDKLVRECAFEVSAFIMSKKAYFEAVDGDGRNFLSWAAEGGNCVEMEKLCKDSLNVVEGFDLGDNNGRTPLSWAAGSGNVGCLELLLKKEVDVNSHDNKRWTPLCHAASNQHLSAFETLLMSGADPFDQAMDGVQATFEERKRELQHDPKADAQALEKVCATLEKLISSRSLPFKPKGDAAPQTFHVSI